MPVPYRATFSFDSPRGRIIAFLTGIQVQTPVAEVVDMTPATAPERVNVRVPTGHVTGGTIAVDFLFDSTLNPGALGADPALLIGSAGTLEFRSTAYNVSRQAVLEGVTKEARVEQVVRGQMIFRITDYANQTGRFAVA